MPASDGIPLRDFLEDAFETIEWDALRAVVHALDDKSRTFQAHLRPASKLDQLSYGEVNELVGMMFAVRRQRGAILHGDGAEKFINATRDLLYGQEEDLTIRLDEFLAKLDGAASSRKTIDTRLREPRPDDASVMNPALGVEVAGELLHFTFPERYWLWSRWMYDADAHTGVLPLLMDGDKELRADSPGQTYLRVGRAIVVVTEVEDAKWLFRGGLAETPALRPFAIDTFLAASYCAYLYGVTAWRLTREFHKVLPPLPRLVRRMFGLKIQNVPNMPNGANEPNMPN
jgi:hypothetical protein